jgi:prepilin-type N-terminal cleavage/methylation domain-containing protein
MKRKRGFTLIELIVAVLFFGLASAGIALFYATNNNRIIQSEKSARMEVAVETAYEGFKGNLMRRKYEGGVYSELLFDSIWANCEEGNLIFTNTDTINAVIFNSEIFLDSFEFDTSKTGGIDDKNLARTFDSGSRIWVIIKTKNLSNGDSIRMRTVFSHHR